MKLHPPHKDRDQDAELVERERLDKARAK